MSVTDVSSANAGLYDDLLAGRLAEDENREPHEKETAIHIEGDNDRATITSFKKVVFEKLLKRPEFEVKSLTVVDTDRNERTATLPEFLENPALTIIGVRGTAPIGCLSFGVGRNSDSHAGIVKS